MADISDSVPEQVSNVPLKTRPVIQNNTVFILPLCGHNNWAGDGAAPSVIPLRQTVDFTHTADCQGSIGAVVYGVGVGYQWIVAWSNPGPMVNKKAYTQILNPLEQINWDDIKSNLDKAGNKSAYGNGVLRATVVIDLIGASPTLTAVLEFSG